MDHASNNSKNIDGEYGDSTVGQDRAEFNLQGNIVQVTAGIASARKNLHCCFTEEVYSPKY